MARGFVVARHLISLAWVSLSMQLTLCQRAWVRAPRGAREVPASPTARRVAGRGGRRAREGPGGKVRGDRGAAGRKRPGGGRYSWPLLCVMKCAGPARKLAQKFLDSRRNGVDSCQKGELTSLLYPEMPEGNSPAK